MRMTESRLRRIIKEEMGNTIDYNLIDQLIAIFANPDNVDTLRHIFDEFGSRMLDMSEGERRRLPNQFYGILYHIKKG
tara:strand:+ start:2074 stop:2307 length:234 start_codon:yes stop_codon:yes gene_type:complete